MGGGMGEGTEIRVGGVLIMRIRSVCDCSLTPEKSAACWLNEASRANKRMVQEFRDERTKKELTGDDAHFDWFQKERVHWCRLARNAKERTTAWKVEKGRICRDSAGASKIKQGGEKHGTA